MPWMSKSEERQEQVRSYLMGLEGGLREPQLDLQQAFSFSKKGLRPLWHYKVNGTRFA